MASSLRTKARIAASVLFAFGFWDALAGRFVFHRDTCCPLPANEEPEPAIWRDLRGALHVHTCTYSDGAGDVPTVMEAAREAGVDWLLLADHNTLQPLRDGWEERYDGSPLLVIATEITVKHGAFLLALDMPPEWEPTKGQKPQVAIDEVNAHGGLPLISLPFDVKHPWRDWDVEGCEGLEVLNLSTIARRHINLLSFTWLLPLYFTRGAMATLRALVTRPDQAIARWDQLTENGKPSVGIGALDAHALMKIGPRKYPIPSYADSFRAAATHVLLFREEAVSAPRAAIHEALRAGRCYFSYDCLGDPTGLAFFACEKEGGRVEMGQRTHAVGPEAPAVTLKARSPRPETLLRLYRQGKLVAAGTGRLEYAATTPGAYRLEAYHPGFRIGGLCFGARPWAFTNPIYLPQKIV